MKKSEIQKSLRKLRSVFSDDAQALESLDLLSFKAEAFPDEKIEAKVDFSVTFPLPDEMRELSHGYAVFADGACRGNPGPGAWAAMIQDSTGEVILKSSGVDVPTTNNKMELQAVIEGLRFIKSKERCKIYSDSLYVINCAIGKWKRKANQDLWNEYEKVSFDKNIEFEWVKGHSGNEYNEKVDKMALNEARSIFEI